VHGVDFKNGGTSNLNSHRIRLNAGPDPRLNFTLGHYHLRTDVPLQTGQKTYGNEVDLIVHWAISKQLFFLGVAGIASPGEEIKAQTQGAAPRTRKSLS
jgi:hypothetical protein